MRRKNVLFTVFLVIFLILLDGMGVPLRQTSLEFAAGDSPVSLKGKVLSVETKEKEGCRMEVRVIEADGHELMWGEKILLDYKGEMEHPWELCRSTVVFRGQLKVPQGRRNPGCFDYRRHLLSQGIFFQTETKSFLMTEPPSMVTDRAAYWLLSLRSRFTEVLEEESKALVPGVLFGDTSALSDQVYDAFRSNGTAHVLAVSGLHVGILYNIYRKLFGRKQSMASITVLAALLGAYGTVSMWCPSVVRASLMIGIHAAAELLDLRYDMLTGLSTVAFVLILQNPYVIFSAGFQMSFLAIASICFLTRILPVWIPDSMATTLAVNLGLQLYQIYQFNYISLVSLLVNIPVIYLTGILVPASLLSFLVFAVTGMLPGLCSLVMDSLSFLTVGLNTFSAMGGRSSLEVVSPPLTAVLCGYFLLFFLSSEQNLILRLRNRRLLCVLVLGICILGGVILSGFWYCPVSDDQLVFVDVGQGDCVHVRAGRKNVLIDGGGSFQYNIGEDTLKPYLLKNGVGNVDFALATHQHMDHYKGLEELREVYPVRSISSGLSAGQTLRLSDKVWIETLWPTEEGLKAGQEANENCSVFMIHYGTARILITGDLDAAGEEKMLEYYANLGQENRLKAEILKIGHHGSQTSTSDRFLEAVSPEYAVIQVGMYNNYGHPNQNIIEKCQKRGIIVKRNDYNGAVGFSFQKGSIDVHTVIP